MEEKDLSGFDLVFISCSVFGRLLTSTVMVKLFTYSPHFYFLKNYYGLAPILLSYHNENVPLVEFMYLVFIYPHAT